MLDFAPSCVSYSRKGGISMFAFTPQERKVILFLASVALLGLGVNFTVKVNSRAKRFVQVDNRITKINLNKAGLEDMLSVRAISLKLANSILAYRNAKGSFSDIEELKEIKGIGDYRYEKLKDLFYVE